MLLILIIKYLFNVLDPTTYWKGIFPSPTTFFTISPFPGSNSYQYTDNQIQEVFTIVNQNRSQIILIGKSGTIAYLNNTILMFRVNSTRELSTGTTGSFIKGNKTNYYYYHTII